MAILQLSQLLILFSGLVVFAEDIGTFWQLTDLHYDANYSSLQSQDSMCHYWAPDVDSEKHGEFGDYACDAPWTLVVSAINAMKLLQPNPDFVIWTGDSIPHVPDSELNPPKVFSVIQNVTSKLTEVFADVPIFPVLGNHDVWPANQLPGQPDAYYDNIIYSSGWENLLTSEAKETFQKGGFYSMKTPHGQRILGLNTNMYYYQDHNAINLTDPALQFMWLEQQLSMAQRTGERAYIISHVPPGTMGRSVNIQWFTASFNKHFLEILQTYSDCIAVAIFGHEHTDSFRIVYDKLGVPVISMFMAPAVTPWRSTLIHVGANNPAIRLYHYDRESGNVLDYQQYFLNLSAANIVGRADWTLEYTATEAYDIKDILPENLNKAVENFKQKSSATFQKYYKYNSVSQDLVTECNTKCKLGHICAMTNISYDVYDKCLENYGKTAWQGNHFPASMMIHFGNHIEGQSPPSKQHNDKTPAFVYFVIAGVVVLLSIMLLTLTALCFKRRNVSTYFGGQPQYMPITA